MDQDRSVPDPKGTADSSGGHPSLAQSGPLHFRRGADAGPDGAKRAGSGQARRGHGEMSDYSATASGLSALGRARQHAVTEQAGQSPPTHSRDPSAPDEGQPSPHTRGPLMGLTAVPKRRRRRFRKGTGADRLTFQPRRSRHRWRREERKLDRGRGGLHRTRRARSVSSLALWALLAVVVLVVLGGVYAIVQVSRSTPQPVVEQTRTVPAAVAVPGPPAALPWPAGGESAVALTGFGLVGSSGPARPVPIASLAKVMTALIVLQDHPLRPGEEGPSLTITPADEALYRAENAAGDSVTPVVAGERLSEQELLEALLIPSADNVAPVLARWDAGSDGAFVARMNAVAARLGMTASHYADDSGLTSGTVGTALDQLKLAEAAAANPVLMSIVGQPAATLPDGTTLSNYDTLLGRNGVIGIKTGSTTAAGGCFMLAAHGVVRGRSVVVLGVVLGQHSSPLIGTALKASRALITPALAALHPVTVVPAGTTVAQVVTPWASPVPVKTTRAITLDALAGMTAHVSVRLTGGPHPVLSKAGRAVAAVTASVGPQSETVPAATVAPVPPVPLHWRLERL